MGLPEKKEDSKYSYKDYCSWPDDERWEIIAGVVYDMSPAPSRRHQNLAGALFNKIYNYLEDKYCEVYIAPFDVRLPDYENDTAETTYNIVQPDIAVICDPEKLDDAGCKGAPDWIIEILSPATAGKDEKEKLYLYEKHGVSEYWLVHPDDMTVRVYILGEDKKYKRSEIYIKEDKIEAIAVNGLVIDLKMVFKPDILEAREKPADYKGPPEREVKN
ncbi:MAG: Uma2 family endonuclease [Spirochaetales bacterium]|jgi:Uma2 family endonuclease|nr:Uma2 family endonuclease [Spirochaetales bacterium]